MSYNRINNVTGWVIFAIATFVYVATLEPTASFWDCGEFISASYKLQVPHPPGAPFFLLIGRIFSFFAGDDLQRVAYMVNLVSALSSSATILFLFWTITIFAKKIVSPEQEPTVGQTMSIMGAGIVGSLAFTFSDSFWFSAVEAEVYAMSSFFTAIVFWAILKWEARADQPGADKWLILIAYLVGLSIGVHLLNLVALPALAFVYYFKRYKTIEPKEVIITFVISVVIIGVIMVGIIPGLPSIAGWFEIKFVNSLHLPFNSGIIFFLILFLAALVYGIFYSIKEQKVVLNTSLVALTFILIGYASYGIILVRSNFDPPIDENDPENVLSFVSYLKREQYGDRPLLTGPWFNTPMEKIEKTDWIYRKGETKYEPYDQKTKVIYKKNVLFPRMYSSQPHHVRAYREWAGLREDQNPTMGDNIKFFFRYQLGHMYFRYFGWNFIGRDSDVQGAGVLRPWDSKDELPELLANNKARNNFFMLPLLLGLVGFVFHYYRHRNDAIIVSLLFFFTGIAIIIYLNQPPVEPRERDYTYTGSFYAFAIWIGLGVISVAEFLRKYLKSDVISPVLATLVCLSVPGVMAAEGWDDHDRSNRYHSVDSAKNLLNSCAPNAILFTGGDNDTFPLWYAQEVEDFRTDVRVVNLSLLNTDWYIDQMKRKAYKSAPLPISLERQAYLQGTNDQVFLEENANFLDLARFLKAVNADDPRIKLPANSGEMLTALPSKKVVVNVDKAKLMQSKDIPDSLKQYILDKLAWQLTGTWIEKAELIMLDMIASNNWERPIYFSTTLSPSNFLNLREYMQLEGLAYRLMPVKVPSAPQGWVNTELMKTNLLKNFFYRNLDNPNVYYDENYLRFPINLRFQFLRLVEELYNQGKTDEAKEVIEFCIKVMPDKAIPYDAAMPGFLPYMFKTGLDQKAVELANIMGKRAEETLAYNFNHPHNDSYNEIRMNLGIMQQMFMGLKEAGKTQEAAKYESIFEKYFTSMRNKYEGTADEGYEE